MKAYVKYLIGTALLASMGWACGGSNEADTAALRKEITELRKELGELKKASAETDVDLMAHQIVLGTEKFYETHAVLDCSGRGFLPVKESGDTFEGKGHFLVACDDAAPYLNGHRLTLRIGNPQAATYNGINLVVQWGKAIQKEGLWEVGWRNKELSNMAKQSFSLPDSIIAGSWSTVHIVLAPSKPEDLAVIVVSLETNNVRLAR